MKNQIVHKLRDKSGVSMLLAMIFLMFCVFIGGTVLAAASANGYRAANRSKQQQYLDERSAALLLSEQLKTDEDHRCQLIIEDVTVNKQNGSVGAGGEWEGEAGSAESERIITFRAMQNTEMSGMQRLLMESAVWNYLKKDMNFQTQNVELKGFWYNGDELGGLDDFWTKPDLSSTENISGTVSVDGAAGGAVFADYDVRYTCDAGYGFSLDFGDDSQVVVEMTAMSDSTEPTVQKAIKTESGESGNVTVQINSTQVRTVIVWNDPSIEKGGAAE